MVDNQNRNWQQEVGTCLCPNFKHVALALSTDDRYKLDKNLRKFFVSCKGLEKTIGEGSKDQM